MSTQRRLQRDAGDVASKIAAGEVQRRRTFLYGVPGAGKTLAAITFFLRLRAPVRHVKNVLWVVPNDALKKQVADNFESLTGGLKLSSKRSDPRFWDVSDPRCVGYVTTYQALGAMRNGGAIPSAQLHVDEITSADAGPWLVVFDECHHLAETDPAGQRTWAEAAAPVESAARHVLLMTGTPERADGRRIPWIDYVTNEEGLFVPDDLAYGIPPYTFREALQDRALVPIEFHAHDGWAKFVDLRKSEEPIERRIGEDMPEDEVRAVIRAFLHYGSYWRALLDRAILHWEAWRAETGYDWRMLVICDSQPSADGVLTYMQGTGEAGGLGMDGVLKVTHNNGRIGRRELELFRKNKTDKSVLITVSMASEGFDAPDISHVVYLSDIRSMTWAKQALFRGARVDRKAADAGVPWAKQRCFAFVPDDALMQEIMRSIEEDQACAGLEEVAANEPCGAGNGGSRGESPVTAQSAEIGDDRLLLIHDPGSLPSGPRPRRLPPSPSRAEDDKVVAEIERLAKRWDLARGRKGSGLKWLVTAFPDWRRRRGPELAKVRDAFRSHGSGLFD